jgi:2-polyprenyl-6-methoxyphenol hydroxylase-like FAD-dependent oxidoreductase
MKEYPMPADVVIVGGGPNGLMLACELGLAGLRPIVLERLPEPSGEAKANGLVGQIVQLIDRRGLYERLAGTPGPPVPNGAYFMYGGLGLNLSLLDRSPLYTLPIPQAKLVRLLAERAVELGVEIRAGHELVGLTQQEDAVTLDVAGPEGTYQLPTAYVVGADGAHSATRKLSGIEFPGVTHDRQSRIVAHVSVPPDWVDPATGALNVPGFGVVRPFLPVRTDTGGFGWAPLPGQAPTIATSEWDRPAVDGSPTLADVRASIRRVLDVDVPVGPPTGPGPHILRRLVSNTRVAQRFRDGRVFLLGDAAHIYATGGLGLNLGMQDAVNLAWKLAAVLGGTAPQALLDTYEPERRQAAERMVVNTHAQDALIAPGGGVTALRTLFQELLQDKDTVQRLADLTAGSDLRYDLGPHPLAGWFAPDLDLATEHGTIRLADLTRTARPLLLDLTDDGWPSDALADWNDRVDVMRAAPQPGVPAALLLRPDTYVAWAADSPDIAGLRAAADRWLGAPRVRQLTTDHGPR